MNDIQRHYVEQANASHAAFLAQATTAERELIEMVNRGREVGIRLQSVRDANRHWEQLTLGMRVIPDTLTLNFTEQHGKGFLRMAERLKQPATTMAEAVSAIKDAFMLQGTLPFPDGHGEQHLHQRDPATIITRWVMDIQATFNRDLRDQIPTMSADRKRSLAKQIEPIVRIHELLAA